MSKSLSENNDDNTEDVKAIAIPQFFSENILAKKEEILDTSSVFRWFLLLDARLIDCTVFNPLPDDKFQTLPN